MAEFRALEAAAETSGLEWTSLRCTDFDANALAWVPQLRGGDVVRGAYGLGRRPRHSLHPLKARQVAWPRPVAPTLPVSR
jgi:uncharacterized protein YbjT (DUF2867 family)